MKKVLILMMGVIILSTTVLVGCQGSVSPLEDIKWFLVSYGEPGNVKVVLPDTGISARFNSETNEMEGNGGCNNYFGTYEVDGDELTMKEVWYTEMWCGEEIGAQESKYLKILGTAESFEVDGNTLTIYSGDNILEFEGG